MKINIIIMSLSLFFVSFQAIDVIAQSNSPTADEILKAIDDNMLSDTKIVTSKMIVHGRRGDRTVTSISWIEGENRAFTEYTSPPREKGTKMLKLDDKLWTYSPSSDRVIQISGHMLRQSVMGSDLSYEDYMEQDKLIDVYQAVIIGSDSIDGRDCWELSLTAKTEDVAYYSRKIWVDKQRFIPLKEERFGREGKLLKSTRIEDVKKISGRWYPGKIIFKDELKTGSLGTEWIIEDIKFNEAIPEVMFSKASLKK
jgi:outer membrane lipoprotein-sorting protein